MNFKIPYLLMSLFFVLLVSCSDEDNDDDNQNSNPDIPETEVNINTMKGGSSVHDVTVGLSGTSWTPANFSAVSAYNGAADLFTFSVIQTSGSTIPYSLTITIGTSNFGTGTYSLEMIPGTLTAASYRNTEISSTENYVAQTGSFEITDVENIGSSSGVDINYIEGAFNFTARGQSDSTDVLTVEGTFRGLAAPEN